MSFEENSPKCRTRLNNIQIRVTLSNQVNSIGSPYGGTVSVYVTSADVFQENFPVELTFSGVILQPYFYYGMNSDEGWENELSKLPGPFAYLDTGNLVQLGPSSLIRSSHRMNDIVLYWRSALQIAQTTARDNKNYGNLQFGRTTYPCIIYYDDYVPIIPIITFKHLHIGFNQL